MTSDVGLSSSRGQPREVQGLNKIAPGSAGGREGNKNRVTGQSREFFSQFLDLLNNDESVSPDAIRQDRRFLHFRISKEKGILRCQEF
jgi:hypothetical protein